MHKFIFSAKFWLTLIFLLFLLTRLYKIAEIPLSIYWDEASIGYNAYSISSDLKDEWGKFLPLHFRAFGEFKLPVYIYTTAIFTKIFGLNEFSVRIPAVLFSFGVIVLIYLLSERLLKDRMISLLSVFFITISPWFFIFSRTGYEATAGLMFYLLATYFFILGDKRGWYILASVISFILSAYSYNSFRVIAPLTLLISILLYHEPIFRSKRSIIFFAISLVFLLLSLIPVYRLYKFDAGGSRLQAVGEFHRVNLIKNYLTHFSPDFLLSGDKNPRSQQPGFGQIYMPDLLLIIAGFLYLIRRRSGLSLFLPLLVLIGPIPAALTKESPHALRSISMVPFLCIFAALGFKYLTDFFPKQNIVRGGILILFLGLFTNYFINFLTVYPIQSAQDWQVAYKRLFLNYKDEFSKYSHVVITDKYAQPYIFTLFYLKYSPLNFRESVVRNNVDQWGFSTVKRFGKFEFAKIPGLFIFER